MEIPYKIEEPYQDWEETEVTLSYDIGVNTYRRVDGWTLLGILPKLESTVEVKNTSDYGGNFKLRQTYKTTLDEYIEFEDEAYITSGGSHLFSFEEELQNYVQIKPLGYRVTAPVKTERKQVTKFRYVTKYRKCNSCDEGCE